MQNEWEKFKSIPLFRSRGMYDGLYELVDFTN